MFSFSSDRYPEVELLGHMVIIFLFFWGTSILLSIVTAPIYTPTSVHEGFLFSASSPTLISFFFFYDNHSDRCEVTSPGFDLRFPDDLWCWTFFCMTVGHLYVSFGKKSIQVFCPFFNQIFYFFCYWVVWALYIFWILTPYWIYDLQISSTFSRLPFHFADGFLCCTEAF